MAALIGTVLFVSLWSGAGESPGFGFSGREDYPIDPQISLLHVADLNRDGLNDLIVVNNARSKINLLYNRTGHSGRTSKEASKKYDLNELPPDARFRIDSIPSEMRIAALVVADLNHDGWPDLAYYGDPKQLVVQYNRGTNGWSLPKQWDLEDGLLDPNALVTGDLNGDHRADLLLLAENHIDVFLQKSDGTLGEPEKIAYTGTVKALQAIDINGDSRDDLLEINWDSPLPFRFRLQNEQGKLGPEHFFELPPIRAYYADDLDGDHHTEIITITQKSGRAQIFTFHQKPAENLTDSFKKGQFEVLPLSRTSRAKRGVILADINGDHLPDLLVAQPDSGQLTYYQQTARGTFSAPETFPTLTGVSDIGVADWDGDGKPDIFVLGSDERHVGVTRLDRHGRIAFPQIFPLNGRPLAIAVGKLRTNAPPSLAVILDQDGQRSLIVLNANGHSFQQKLSETFKSNPASMQIQDVDQDGLPDLVLLIPYEKIKILRQRHDRTFQELDVSPPGGSSDHPWMTSVDVDGDGKPELLLGQKNFVRAVVLKSEKSSLSTNLTWTFQVKDQINGVSSNSRISGAAALRDPANGKEALFLLDADQKVLTLCEKDKTGAWQILRNVRLPFAGYLRCQAVGLGQRTADSIAFAGLNSVAWIRLSGRVWALKELDDYETPIENGFLRDVVTGDLNNDGRKDLVFLETNRHYIDIVSFEKPHRLVPGIRWPVFEERTFHSRSVGSDEPREAVVADLTGDGKKDLAIIVHDRILVYPQE